MKKLFFLLIAVTLCTQTNWGQQLQMDHFHNIKPRNIGPAGMSGRVTAIDVNLQNPDIIYAGTASGGLWKSEGGGVDWEPIFDTMKVASIGAITINQRNPDVIWVGTGEGNPRNSQTSGSGIYRSLDAGKSWQLMGLEEVRNIHRIIIHRDDPNTVYVAAIGYAWGESPHRGVYRTTDGGKSWDKILYLNERTGAADFIVDPNNPNKMMVNMWEYQRWPWFFKSGGPSSGLYVTLDGGDTWTQRTQKDGLPEGELGKIGLAIAPSAPNVVYALVESKKNALYRSDDGGYKWKKVADKNIGDRPFYYWDIVVDPSNENRIYNVFSNVTVSQDGGKTFETLLGWDNIHGDHHFWWIHPNDPDYMIDGNDGGMAITRDRGKTWRFVENLPVAQFYHIQVDDAIPYNVMGGMQDNGTWRGPSQVWKNGGIRNYYWDEIGFGDGFDVVVDRDNSRYGYVMWQGGNLIRIDFESSAQQWVKPYHPDDVPLRFNWNAGIASDPFDPATIYYGSQFVHKSTDRGQSWEVISPDLTTNDPEKQQQAKSGGLTYDVTGAENHTTILAISPSSIQKDVIWVGTDDGNVQVTKDGGQSWTNVSKNIKGVPAGSWVPQIHASAYKPEEAYVVINDYRRDNWTPYLYRTRNFGQTWERLVDEKDVWGYCLSWVQDPIEPKLQFLGTEFGLYFSLDEGASWQKWNKGYPTVSTIDLKIHPREHDLVIGTFGRAAWILDDIRPLRALARQGSPLLNEPIQLYPAPDAYLAHYGEASATRFTGNAHYKGENRPYGALITFSIKEVLKKKKDTDGKETDMPAELDSIAVEIINTEGQVVRHLKVEAKKGLNRFAWGLTQDGVRSPASPKPKPGSPIPEGRTVAPGIYTAKMVYGEKESTTLITVHPDPRTEVNKAELMAFYTLWRDWEQHIKATTNAMDNLREAKKRIKSIGMLVNEQVQEKERKEAFQKNSKTTTTAIDSLMAIVMPDSEKVQGIYNDPVQLQAKISQVNFYFSPAFGAPNPPAAAPTKAHRTRLTQVKGDILDFIEKVNAFFDGEWKGFEKEVDGLNLELMPKLDSVKIE